MNTALRGFAADARFALGCCRRAHRGLTVLLVVVPLVQSLLPLVAVLALRGLIDTVVQLRADPEAASGAIGWWVALAAVAAFAGVVGGALNVYVTATHLEWLDEHITVELATQAGRLPYALFEDRDFQDTLTHLNEQPGQHLQQLVVASVGMVAALVRIVGLLGVLLSIAPMVVVLLAPLSVPYLIFQLRLSRRRYEAKLDQRTKRRWATYYLNQLTAAPSLAEVRVLGLAPLFVRRIAAILGEFRRRNLRFHRLALAGNVLFGAASIAAIHLALYSVAERVRTGGLRVGDVAVFGAAALALRGALDTVVGTFSGFRLHTRYVTELRDFLDRAPQAPPTQARPARLDRSGPGELIVEAVSFTYPGTDRRVLHDVSLRVRPGEVVALVGENGSGKSTLVKLVAGLYRPDAGTIRLDGVDLAGVEPAELAGVVTVVFQAIGRYEATLAENVAFGDWATLGEDPAAIRAVIERVGIAGLVDRMPEGADTLLGRRFGLYEPSGGQWQQIAIARANARPGVVQILDEPTSNLDVRTEHAIFARYRELARGRTTLLISHRLSTVMLADRIVVLDGGRIAEEGTHDELVRRDGIYAGLYRLHRRDAEPSEPTGDDRG